MTNYIEEMMRTAGIEPKYEDCCKIADKYWNNEELANEYDTFDNYMNKNCTEGDSGACFSTCEYAYDKKIYPDFTPEKQLKIEDFIIKNVGYLRIDYTKEIPEKIQQGYQYNVFGGSFEIHSKNYIGITREQALAQLTTELMKAGELDKEKVKEILE